MAYKLVHPDIKIQRTSYLGKLLVDSADVLKTLDEKKDSALIKSINKKGIILVNDYVKVVPKHVVETLVKKGIIIEVQTKK